jgi:uncharacterized membrane protein YhaH (DUF805 family)
MMPHLFSEDINTMITKKNFRILVTIHLVLFIAAMASQSIHSGWPIEALNYEKYIDNVLKTEITFYMFLLLPALLCYLISVIGLFRFKNYGKYLFLIFPVADLMPLNTVPFLHSSFNYCLIGLEYIMVGVITTLMWTSPVKNYFTASSQTISISTIQNAGINFFRSVKVCLSKYGIFSGRACRSEYWWFWLFGFVIVVGSSLVNTCVAYVLYFLLLLPMMAVQARRLHDVGKSGWWQLIGFIPIPIAGVVGMIILYYWSCGKGDAKKNDYGEGSVL